MSGKGSAPRKSANQKAYEENWERIFGNKRPELKSITQEILDCNAGDDFENKITRNNSETQEMLKHAEKSRWSGLEEDK